MILHATVSHATVMATIHARALAPADGRKDAESSQWGAPWSETAFAIQLRLPGTLALINPAGGLLLARLAGGEAELLALAVVPERRRQGFGRALLQDAMAAATAAGAERMILEVAAGNIPARALYATAGFRQIGLRRAYYAANSDALVLAAQLPFELRGA